MDDHALDFVQMGKMLRSERGDRSRRELAERTGLSQSQLQKVEEGRTLDITLTTLRKLAEGYEVSPFRLLSMAMPSKTSDIVDWVMENEEVRHSLERSLGRRVVVEATPSPAFLERVDALGAQVERVEGLVVALRAFGMALPTRGAE